MGLVSDIMTSLDNNIHNVGQSFFEGTADAMLPIMTIFLTISLLALGMNMALGVVRMDARSSVHIATRIVMIYLFAFSWSNFGAVYQALSETSVNIAMSFFSKAADSGSDNLNAAIDQFAKNMGETADGVAKSMGSIMRGFLGAVFYVVLALLMAAYVLIVGFAKIMIAMLIGMAPIAIVMSIFERTKFLFEAWLSAFVSYLMYPIAAAAVIATVVAVAAGQYTSQDNVDTISGILGFFVVVFVGIFALASIPNAAHNLTGQMNLASFAPQALSLTGKAISLSQRALATRAPGLAYAGQAVAGFAGMAGSADAAKATNQRSAREAGAALRSKLSTIATLRR